MNDFARSQTMLRLTTLASALQAAVQEPPDAKAIHALRVGLRRFDQCLRTFAPLLQEKPVAKIRAQMGKLMDRCGAARNCDIALDLLEEAGIGGRAKVVGEIRERRRETEQELAKSLKRWRHREISAAWPERLFASEAPDFDVDLGALAADLFVHGHAAAAEGSSHAEMHQFRLRVKRFRYAVEIFQSLYEQRAIESVVGELKALQNLLGVMNDCVSALELVQGHGKAERGIRRILRQRERAFRSHWKEQLGAGKLKEWISIFSVTVRQNLDQPASRKRPASSQRAAAKTSAA